MALTQTTSLDVVGQTSTISFYQSATLVDQVTVSLQEFFMNIYMLQQYQVQVQVN